MKLLGIGFGNFVSLNRIVGVFHIDSSPIKRIIHVSKEKNLLIDATCGRKTQSVLLMDSDHVVLSALSSEVISEKINSLNSEQSCK